MNGTAAALDRMSDLDGRAEEVRRGLLRDLAVWLRMTPEERGGSPMAGTPADPGIFDASEDPAVAEWYGWAPDPRDPAGDVAIIVTEDDFDDVAGPLELLAEDDRPVTKVGRGLCEELEEVRDGLLDAIVDTARRVGDPTCPCEHAELRGLIRALALVLDVPVDEANRQALRRIGADRARRAA